MITIVNKGGDDPDPMGERRRFPCLEADMPDSTAPISDTVRKIVSKELALLVQLRDGKISKGVFAKRWPCTRRQAGQFEAIVDRPLIGENDDYHC